MILQQCGGDKDHPDYIRYIAANQNNHVNSSGNFSLEVLSEALKNFSLTLVRHGSQESRDNGLEKPEQLTRNAAYICNFRAHWLALRRIGGVWYNLNSLSGFSEIKAEPISVKDGYLAMYLMQLKLEGYSIFTVLGELPRANSSLSDFNSMNAQ